jgi:ribosome recycling factor
MPFDFKPFDEKAAAAREWLRREFTGLRTGRATPSILDGVSVSAYGSIMPLKQVASVSIEDPRTLRVQPYDCQCQSRARYRKRLIWIARYLS